VTDAKAIRFAAVLVALAGYALVFRIGESRIAARLAANAAIAEQIDADRRLFTTRTALERERGRLHAAIRTAETETERGALVARFLRDASVIASSHHVVITTVTAGAASAARVAPPTVPQGPTAPSTADRGTTDPFETISLDLVVEGRYADVLSTARALSASSYVLASVEIASLARKANASREPALTASLGIVLHRVAARPV
jgi:hypothetical protein